MAVTAGLASFAGYTSFCRFKRMARERANRAAFNHDCWVKGDGNQIGCLEEPTH